VIFQLVDWADIQQHLTMKEQLVTCHTGPRNWKDFLERPRHRKIYTRFGTLNVIGFSRTGSLKKEASELENCNLELVAVQDVRWQ
jgi:hypothetical protein